MSTPELAEVAPLKTLHEVLKWGFARSPRLEVIDVVIQDEYSHDFVTRVREGVYLCFDTT
jgi:hypothetical protein